MTIEDIEKDLVSRIGIKWGHKFGDPHCICGCRPFTIENPSQFAEKNTSYNDNPS